LAEPNEEYTYEYLPRRGLTRETEEFYRVKTKINSEGKPVSYGLPYGEEATKVKGLDDKKSIHWVGSSREVGFFGQELWSAGSARSVTITTGEEDARSIYQVLGSKYPSVSAPHGDQSAKKTAIAQFDWVNSFEKIYLAFDNDPPGQAALREVASLFDTTKVYYVKLTKHKDANAYLQAGDDQELKQVWWNARRFQPEGIISEWSEFDKIIDEIEWTPGLPIPFPTLHYKLDGLKTKATILIKGQEGLGKTEILRSFESHVLRTTDFNVATIHLEEPKERQLLGLAGHELGIPVHLSDAQVSKSEIKAALRKLTKVDGRLHVYSHFGSDDPHIIVGIIRFLASACNCKLVTLDPFNHVVTGVLDEDERKMLDMMIMSIATLAQTHDFAFVYTAHTNPDGSTRGSKMMSKAASVVLNIKRDPMHESEYMKRVTELDIEKNRPTSITGAAGKLIFNPDTFMLSELSEELPK
jgi:twinkle protein